MPLSVTQTCIIIGASHSGVTAAFALRKEGWQGEIIMIDSDPAVPYHRPPLSKAYLANSNEVTPPLLKPIASYEKNNITLMLGKQVSKIDSSNNNITLQNGDLLSYDKLILATGASPFIPPITGIDTAQNLFTLRTQADVENIRSAFLASEQKRVVIIGGGYIGLETAASIKKMGGDVSVLEREPRLLARVTSPEMSAFFHQLHENNGVTISTEQNVQAIKTTENTQTIVCENGSEYPNDIIIVGVGVKVNQALAQQAGLTIDNGIVVNDQCQTSHQNIYAIGDCAYHHNKHYNCWLRLESVQNAVDQAKVAALSICKQDACYDALPWFWSDQFNIKLQIVGLSTGYNNLIVRKEADDEEKFSVWYFKDEELLSVDTINHAKAYVLGTKIIKNQMIINKNSLSNSDIALSLETLSQ
ncbi:NAD(P)/FAD-dependent oxidoreductase [Colwellia sp. MSW7]|uniref:NAD(P)/FAD-dependent oxidoreductase n=1 Tax=Colwellia maritima TaxID=2912588 RepID=A0ABS9X0X9_9GAMM|nr:FAD/NAD(P)-binding oxidoreductase [Colwellia maritima]MCI2283895.1 NAD(P)/FAD-dependent oxidoreductase [Colwellia maritima]